MFETFQKASCGSEPRKLSLVTGSTTVLKSVGMGGRWAVTIVWTAAVEAKNRRWLIFSPKSPKSSYISQHTNRHWPLRAGHLLPILEKSELVSWELEHFFFLFLYYLSWFLTLWFSALIDYFYGSRNSLRRSIPSCSQMPLHQIMSALSSDKVELGPLKLSLLLSTLGDTPLVAGLLGTFFLLHLIHLFLFKNYLFGCAGS